MATPTGPVRPQGDGWYIAGAVLTGLVGTHSALWPGVNGFVEASGTGGGGPFRGGGGSVIFLSQKTPGKGRGWVGESGAEPWEGVIRA